MRVILSRATSGEELFNAIIAGARGIIPDGFYVSSYGIINRYVYKDGFVKLVKHSHCISIENKMRITKKRGLCFWKAKKDVGKNGCTMFAFPEISFFEEHYLTLDVDIHKGSVFGYSEPIRYEEELQEIWPVFKKFLETFYAILIDPKTDGRQPPGAYINDLLPQSKTGDRK